jgi:hypothetical protein
MSHITRHAQFNDAGYLRGQTDNQNLLQQAMGNLTECWAGTPGQIREKYLA